MPRNGHSGRCFRDRRHTAERKIRQGTPAQHQQLATLAHVAGFFNSVQAGLRFSVERLLWLIKQSPTTAEGFQIPPKAWHRRMVKSGM